MIPLNLLKPYLYFGGIVAICLGVGYVYTLPEKYRQEGRKQERSAYRKVSDGAVLKREFEFLETKEQLAIERKERQDEKIKHEEKFNKYVADVRAGRVSGLRIRKDSVCPARTEEIARTSGNAEEKTTGLPREVEEGLFRFAHDRDEIIMAFEEFKQEVRIAKCFADTQTEPKK